MDRAAWDDPLHSDLATWFADAVDAYTLEKPTKGKRRARSMDVCAGVRTAGGGGKEARRAVACQPQSMFTTLGVWGDSWNEIADRFQMDVRIASADL